MKIKNWKKDIGFQVITKVSKGSYYDMVGVKKGEALIFEDYKRTLKGTNPRDLVWAKRPIFTVGEILIVYTPTGREVSPLYLGGYGGRNAGKWDVDYKEFRSLFEAIKFARKLTKDE